jgi:hypothetical protein
VTATPKTGVSASQIVARILGLMVPALAALALILSARATGCWWHDGEGTQRAPGPLAIAADPGPPVGSIDAIRATDGTTRTIAGESTARIAIEHGLGLTITGWGADSKADRPASGILGTMDKRGLQSVYGTPRPDVAKALGTTGVSDTGFIVYVPSSDLTPGMHEIRCYVLDSDGTHIRAFPNRLIVNVAP